nr:immunoglobulin heavy chain junction region [Macaca mulatta]MOX38687.1 immunoglobulin heavy chain junction region [Macaca mulatta]MOX40098.1 immunoglobulin heavy chain junction region [Macaca mulatta]MOX41531.1 immunoglobulin heavy chain junction region [Macaca mulatta]
CARQIVSWNYRYSETFEFW